MQEFNAESAKETESAEKNTKVVFLCALCFLCVLCVSILFAPPLEPTFHERAQRSGGAGGGEELAAVLVAP